ncbi:MAG TPA: nicotinate (nicotinamide) nucleotide adenylyltransferase [Planctomycetales bacterium]|nr:nicotinate (nicotinamide) nucleotide adenylyltransferase [Planctomycetales bacterium]
MRVGVFGGTFDPVHYGHLILAEQCRQQGRLDEVLFVPAPRPPHKPRPVARFEQRVEMLALALAGNPTFHIEEVEKERDGPSYTVDTLAELHRRRPGDDLLLLVGGDAVHDLPLWYEPRRILELAGLLVVGRPNSPPPDRDDLRARIGLPADAAVHMEVVEVPLIDISSRDLRRRAAEGRSFRYLLPRAVECYVHDKRLYRGEPSSPRAQ